MSFETEGRYYLDQITGEVKTYKARKIPSEKFRIKSDHVLDPNTRQFCIILKDENGIETNTALLIKSQVIEAVQ